MYNCRIIGLFIAVSLSASYCTSISEKAKNIESADYYYDNTDGSFAYYEYDDDDEAKSTTAAPLVKTSSTVTQKSINILNDYFLEIPKPEPTCPDECDCSAEEIQFVNCSHRNLVKVPNNIPNTAIRIDLSFNLIEELYEEDFLNCSNTRELILNSNKISQISREMFNNLPRLNYIGLANNSLTIIDPDIFNLTTDLTKIDFTDNPIELSDMPFLNQPELEELNLTRCNLHELNENTFKNLNGLLSLNLDENELGNTINKNAFKPLKELRKLKLPELDQNTIRELCNILSSIDTISLKNFDVSCFVLVSGTSFEESIIIPGELTTTTSKHDEREGARIREEPVRQPRKTTTQKPSETTLGFNDKNTTSKLGEQKADNQNDSNNKTYQVPISTSTVNHILIGIIVVALVGLVIGIICRRDICGIKTKLCRTRQPPPTDQVRPAEEVPLNKV